MAVYQGIDKGNKGLRSVTIKGNWGKFEIAPTEKPLKKIVSLPSNLITFRQISFPFSDKKRIREVLPGELAESIILPIEEVTWDISSTHKEQANVIIAPTESITEFTESLGNSIKYLDAEPCALARVAAYNNIKDALIIDFGATRTTLCGIKEGRLNMVRTRMLGGNQIDESISREKSISLTEAENFKIETGLSYETTENFMKNVLDIPPGNEPVKYERIIMTGGGARMPGIAEFLEEIFDVPPELFEMPTGLSPHTDAVAFGTALHEAVGPEKVNFIEQKEEAKPKSYTGLALLLIPLILLSVNLKVEENHLKNENRQIYNAMTQAIRKKFPKIGRIVSPVNQVEALMKKSGGGEEGGMQALKVLSNISKARKGLKVNFYEMDLSSSELKLKGESDSFGSVEKLNQGLKSAFADSNVVEQKTKPGGSVDFYIVVETNKVGAEK